MREYDLRIHKLKACIDYLLNLSMDYQFDKNHPDYCGFINSDPAEHLTENRIEFLLYNISMLNQTLKIMGVNRVIESATRGELILTKLNENSDD